MSILKCIVVCSFVAGALSAVLSIVFRVDAHAMAFPHPVLGMIAIALIVISAGAAIVWGAINIFGGG